MANKASFSWDGTLSKAQQRDSAWEAIKARAELRLTQLLTELCSTKITHETSQVLRGRIAELHGLLALERAPATPQRRGDRLHAASEDEPES
jgi:hypothetical protein